MIIFDSGIQNDQFLEKSPSNFNSSHFFSPPRE